MKKLSIVIPVYNEENTIEELIKRVEQADACGLEKEIIVVDDCSADSSREILRKFSGRHKVVFQPKNQGKGAALRAGFARVSGDIVIIQDADLEYDPNEYTILLKPILDGKADVVYGSRFITVSAHRVLFFWHSIGNRLLTLFSNILTNLTLSDMETCYKVFRREVLDAILPTLKSNRFGIEPELTIKFAKHKFRIYEVGISYFGRTYEEGKKINWRDGVSAVWTIIKFKFFD